MDGTLGFTIICDNAIGRNSKKNYHLQKMNLFCGLMQIIMMYLTICFQNI